MTSEGEGTKRTSMGATAIPVETPAKRHRFTSGKLLWAKLVKESVAAQTRRTAVTHKQVYKSAHAFFATGTQYALQGQEMAGSEFESGITLPLSQLCSPDIQDHRLRDDVVTKLQVPT